MALTKLSFKNVGPPNTPQEIKRLRRQNMDQMRRTGEPVIHKHRYNSGDATAGLAKNCPACWDDIRGASRGDCMVCFNSRYVSLENDPAQWIDESGYLTDIPTDLPAPLYGGYGPPFLTWMVEPDTSVDVFQVNNQGVLVNTQQAQGYAPWYPRMGDNDLIINVRLSTDDFTIQEIQERYELKKVNPQTVRGLGRIANYQDYYIGQQFEMARILDTSGDARSQVPIEKLIRYSDSDMITSVAIPKAIEGQNRTDSGTVVGRTNLQNYVAVTIYADTGVAVGHASHTATDVKAP